MADQPTDWNKAYGAAGSATLGGALAKIVIRYLNYRYPGFVDASITDSIDTAVVGALAGFGAWIAPHKST